MEVRQMALTDVMDALKVEKPERGPAKKKYVAFSAEEWSELEKKYGKTIDPVHVKRLIQGVFSGVLEVRKTKPG
jgi:hypothetical protein